MQLFLTRLALLLRIAARDFHIDGLTKQIRANTDPSMHVSLWYKREMSRIARDTLRIKLNASYLPGRRQTFAN